MVSTQSGRGLVVNWEAFSAIAEWIGVVLIVISLAYVAVQIRQNTKTVRAATELDTGRQWSEFHARVAHSRDMADIWDKALAKPGVEEFEKKIKESKHTDLKEATDKTKAMKDSINTLFDFILGKEDKRQGIVRSPDPTPVSYIQTAQFYIARSHDPIGETDKRVYKHAEDKIGLVTKRVNDFYETSWKPYRELMEKVTLSPFKDYEPLIKQ